MTEEQGRTQPQTPNRRRYPRVELTKGIPVAWQASGLRNVSRAQTLGLGGLFIPTKEPPPVGAVLQVAFSVPDGDIRTRASVANIRPGQGMGVEFKVMRPEERARLSQHLKRVVK